MKFIIAGFVAIVLLCSANHASAFHSENLKVWDSLGLAQVAEFITNDVRWYPDKDYTDADEFPEFRCYKNNVDCHKLRGMYDRDRMEWLERQDRAYSCYRFGKGCDLCDRRGSTVSGCSETKPPQHPRPVVAPVPGRQ